MIVGGVAGCGPARHHIRLDFAGARNRRVGERDNGFLRPREGAKVYDHRALPCHGADPDLWFAESPADVEAAKAICTPCPLREACLAGALERAEPWGVWGGQLVLAGVIVPRKRPRGRPRKDDPANRPIQTDAAA